LRALVVFEATALLSKRGGGFAEFGVGLVDERLLGLELGLE